MRRHPTLMVILLVLAALALAACGSSKKKSSSSTSSTAAQQPATLSISVSESGKKASYSAPATTKGGLVTVTLQNNGKAPHSAQLIEVGTHTPAEVLKAAGSNKLPSWAHLVGGSPTVPPGKTGAATILMPAGNYVIVDFGSMGNGPPTFKTLKVTSGAGGSLPRTGTTLTATAPAKDKYKWDISGPLKAGENRVTFVSKGGKDAVHVIAAARVTGNPSLAKIKKALGTNGPPPKFVDQASFTSTAALDGTGKKEVTSLSLTKPGEYIIFCPLTDRDGGKSHDKEGLLTTINVK